MGIEKLKGSLLSEAHENVGVIESSAQAEAKAIIADEHARCMTMSEEAGTELVKLLEEQRSERLAWARLESKRIMAESKEDAIKNVLELFFDELVAARKGAEYKKFLARSAAAAVEEFGKDMTVHVLKGEKALLPNMKDVKVVEDLEGLGGLRADGPNGKIRLDFTLETLFETRRDGIRKQIYEKIFGAK